MNTTKTCTKILYMALY